jgi:hypothetical protein
MVKIMGDRIMSRASTIRRIAFIVLLTLLPNLPAAAQVNPTAAKETVTIQVDADLLRRARMMNIDLSASMEKQLKAELAALVGASSLSHQALVTEAFDSFEAMLFSPLKVNGNTPAATVRSVCQSMNANLDQLIAYAETRKSMPLPATLEEARNLDQYLAGRFQTLSARMRKEGRTIQASTKIMEAQCADLSRDEAGAKKAMAAALGKYGPVGWCRVMMQKPRAQWTMQDGGNFAKFCAGVQPK